MKKTLYICLTALFFSTSAFADPFNEYDPGNGNYGSPYLYLGAGANESTGFWSTNVTRETASVMAMGTNAYLYMRDLPSTSYYLDPGVTVSDSVFPEFSNAKSITEYQFKPGDVLQIFPVKVDRQDVPGGPVNTYYLTDNNGNLQFGYIVSNNGSTFQRTPPDYTLQMANNNMMKVFVSEPSRPYFSYNVFDVNNNKLSENIYKATSSGPVVVTSREFKPYSVIPRVVKDNVTFAPGSPFMTAGSLFNSSSTSYQLYDAYRIIRDYLDYASPDIVVPNNNGMGIREKEIREKVLPKVQEGLPDELKPDAENILAMYIEQCDQNPNIHPAYLMAEFLNMQKVDAAGLPSNLPFVEGKNYVFDSNGNPKEAGAAGDLVLIEVNGVPKKPSELNVNNPAELKALSKVAVCLAKIVGAPVGTWFNTGLNYKESSAKNPYMTVFNRKGGKFSEGLNNVYSFMNIIQHELGHQSRLKAGIKEDISTHVDVYLDAMEKIQFNRSPPEIRIAVVNSLANYIWNMDQKGYSFAKTKEKIDRFNSRSAYNGGYKIIAPKDPNNASSIMYVAGSLNVTNFKIYDPITNQELPINLELNDEK